MRKLDDTALAGEVLDEIRQMIRVRESNLWRADAGSCCSSLTSLSCQLDAETRLLRESQSALETGDLSIAIIKLKEAAALLS